MVQKVGVREVEEDLRWRRWSSLQGFWLSLNSAVIYWDRGAGRMNCGGKGTCSFGLGWSLKVPLEFQKNYEEDYFVYRTLELSRKSWTGDTDLGFKNITTSQSHGSGWASQRAQVEREEKARAEHWEWRSQQYQMQEKSATRWIFERVHSVWPLESHWWLWPENLHFSGECKNQLQWFKSKWVARQSIYQGKGRERSVVYVWPGGVHAVRLGKEEYCFVITPQESHWPKHIKELLRAASLHS